MLRTGRMSDPENVLHMRAAFQLGFGQRSRSFQDKKPTLLGRQCVPPRRAVSVHPESQRTNQSTRMISNRTAGVVWAF